MSIGKDDIKQETFAILLVVFKPGEEMKLFVCKPSIDCSLSWKNYLIAKAAKFPGHLDAQVKGKASCL
jgi:hypothetical protein